MNRRALLGAAVTSVFASTAGCGSTRGAPLAKVIIAGGTPGGVYQQLAEAFAREIEARWSIPAEVLTTNNESSDNLRLVAEGKATIGFATVDLCDVALIGDPPFGGILPVAALAGVYEDYLQIIFSADRPIGQISDLARYRVSLGAEGSGTDFLAGRLLHAAGAGGSIPKRSYWPGDHAAAEMLAGNLDAFFVMGGLPTPSVKMLATKMLEHGMRLRVLSIPMEAEDLRGRFRHIYVHRSIPAGTYGIDKEVSTIGVGNVIVIHRDAPDEAAFRLTELLLASQPALAAAHPEARRLDLRTAVSTFTIPLHDGALRYYRSTKPFPGKV